MPAHVFSGVEQRCSPRLGRAQHQIAGGHVPVLIQTKDRECLEDHTTSALLSVQLRDEAGCARHSTKSGIENVMFVQALCTV